FKHGLGGTWRSIFIDDVMIETTPDNDLAAISLTGNSTPSVGMATNYTVNIFNWGTNPQTTYTVKLFKEGNIELASVAGPAINPGLSAQAVLSWAPTEQGQTFIYAKVILTGDQNPLNDQTTNLNISVQPAGTMVVTIGAGDELDRIPVDMTYQNSLFETVYLASELNFIGMITGLSFYNSYVTDLPNMPTNVWIGTTTANDLSDAWIPSTSLTQVYSGNVNYPFGQNVVTITFPNPYLYLGENLVMMVQRPMDTTYYNSENQFFCQTVGTARSRNVFSDWDTYDPASPPTDWVNVSGRFPKTGFMIIPGGVGHLNGTVYGAGNVPLNNATVQISGGAQTTTNAQGQYSIINLVAGTYDVTASRYGYLPQSFTVVIPEDSTVVQNFNLTQMPTVNVTGTIVGSDAPTVGLAGATMALTGYENYSVTANAEGQFTIPGVYANQSYEYIASALGYQVVNGTLNVGSVNYSMGTITLDEIAYTPRDVTAALATNNMSVNVTWLAPDPGAVDVDQSFEDAAFPPADWTQTITNIGPANTAGVYPTWCRFGTVVDGTVTVSPSDGNWQAGYWWDYNHQNEWLISPPFNCPQGAYLTFGTYCYYGSLNSDHYYVKVSNNNGVSWDVVWDASALTGGWNNYQTPVVIDLAPYTGQQIKLAWHAEDPSTNDGMWYNWFIDNVQVTNSLTTIRFSEQEMTSKSAGASKALPVKESAPVIRYANTPMTRAMDAQSLSYKNLKRTADNSQSDQRHSRSLQGYKVWRLLVGQEQNETSWSLITPNMITALTYVDNGWPVLPAGNYKWAVKALYTNNVLSLAAFSNSLIKPPTISGTLTGMVRNQSNLPIMGATINAGGQIATSLADGTYTMQVAIGTYAVTCTAPGYQTVVNENIVITENQTTISNFILPVFNEDEVQITQTALKGNYPNPFNPETTIAFDVKGTQTVRIEIYNTKGQLIRTLVDEVKNNGHHTVIWNGRDNHGSAVASGVYHYRMRAGSYKADRRMMLLK
ncbi:MAG: carboxypeptidase regulatory-like domain-containing protein, partial [Candidatus Cloacimonadaceae bacterium]